MKTKKTLLIIGIIVLILIIAFGIYYVYMKYFNGNIEENFCDAKNSCPQEMTCVKLPENEFSICVTQETIDNYVCLEGTEKNIVETLPLKIICE